MVASKTKKKVETIKKGRAFHLKNIAIDTKKDSQRRYIDPHDSPQIVQHANIHE